jgi:hypothetical protein
VIEAHEIDARERLAKALDPPREVFRDQHVPAIERVAPQLSSLAEVVGRDTGDRGGLEVRAELEQLGARPDVGAVVGDVDRHVAQDPNARRVRRRAQRAPLPVEQELPETMRADRRTQAPPSPRERRRLPRRELAVPAVPHRA